MRNIIVIDKDYTFGAYDGSITDVKFHVRCTHEEAMKYGEYFMNNNIENKEIDCVFDIKEKLDDTLAAEIAQNLYDQWKFDNEDEVEEDLTVDDFYEQAYEVLAEYYYYIWSEELKKDCMDYYKMHISPSP